MQQKQPLHGSGRFSSKVDGHVEGMCDIQHSTVESRRFEGAEMTRQCAARWVVTGLRYTGGSNTVVGK